MTETIDHVMENSHKNSSRVVIYQEDFYFSCDWLLITTQSKHYVMWQLQLIMWCCPKVNKQDGWRISYCMLTYFHYYFFNFQWTTPSNINEDHFGFFTVTSTFYFLYQLMSRVTFHISFTDTISFHLFYFFITTHDTKQVMINQCHVNWRMSPIVFFKTYFFV